MQGWKIGKLKAKVTAERAKLEKAVADEAKGGGGGGAGEASRTVRRKLLDEAGDRECLVYTRSLCAVGYCCVVDPLTIVRRILLVCTRTWPFAVGTAVDDR